MERKFKVGDKVRFIGNVAAHINSSALICHQDDLIVNDILDNGDVSVIWSSNGPYRYYKWNMATNEIELIEFTKEDIQPEDVITLRNGARLIFNGGIESFMDIDDLYNPVTCKKDFTDELLCNCGFVLEGSKSDYDIIKVERPTYHTVYERVEEKKEPKKMTVAEISKELGYDVEIVKG